MSLIDASEVLNTKMLSILKLDNKPNMEMSIVVKDKHSIEPGYLMYCSHEDCIETSCDSFSSIELFCAT